MKQLFLFLLFTSISFGQSTVTSQRITNNIVSPTAPFVAVQETNGFINKIAKIDLQDILSFSTESAFPVIGLISKIYIANSSPAKMYRWNGTIYIEAGGVAVADATTTSKGLIQLAGDLAGTAIAPTVPGLLNKQNTLPLTTIWEDRFQVTGLGYQDIDLGVGFNLHGNIEIEITGCKEGQDQLGIYKKLYYAGGLYNVVPALPYKEKIIFYDGNLEIATKLFLPAGGNSAYFRIYKNDLNSNFYGVKLTFTSSFIKYPNTPTFKPYVLLSNAGFIEQKTINIGQRQTITVGGSPSTYATLDLLFANETEGEKDILLIDTNYNVINPKYLVKKGWRIIGQGYGKAVVNMTFNQPIDANLSGFQIRENCELIDFKVNSIINPGASSQNTYALHSDYAGEFKAVFTRMWFITTMSSNVVDSNNYPGLSVGIGTWENQQIEFRECILNAPTVSIDNKYTLNLHNTFISTPHYKPCRVSYYNCQITGGFTTVLISDTYSRDSENNATRVQDLFEFVGCEIKGGIYLRSQSIYGTINKKNGILYNFSGTNIDEFINIGEVVDTSLSNYNINSLPLTKDVIYQKNLGQTNIIEGDFVCAVYGNRIEEYHRSVTNTTIIGVEKINATNEKNFIGLSLTNSDINNFCHIATGGIAYTTANYSNYTIGNKVNFSAGMPFETNATNGIGKIVRKKSNGKIGILLNL